MFTSKSAAAVVVATLSLAVAEPAFGDELSDSLAAINAALAGRWTGTYQSIDPATGAATPIAYDFTLVVTSDDGLDFAYWGPEGLTMVDYQGDGAVRERTWSAQGVLQTSTSTIEVSDGSSDGGLAWTTTGSTTGPSGDPYDTHVSYALTDGALTVLNEATPAGADAPRYTYGSGSWTRGAEVPQPR